MAQTVAQNAPPASACCRNSRLSPGRTGHYLNEVANLILWPHIFSVDTSSTLLTFDRFSFAQLCLNDVRIDMRRRYFQIRLGANRCWTRLGRLGRRSKNL
jgi:hypothetical protein